LKGVNNALPRLAKLGVTVIELMPVNAFPSERNWGYDGILPFAPSASYGSPDELKALIDRAHELDLMMFLDVVYNHLDPRGISSVSTRHRLLEDGPRVAQRGAVLQALPRSRISIFAPVAARAAAKLALPDPVTRTSTLSWGPSSPQGRRVVAGSNSTALSRLSSADRTAAAHERRSRKTLGRREGHLRNPA
jgi:hypothetical protein